MANIEVMQNLRVFAVERAGRDVRVDVYGGAEMVCGSLTYTFDTSSVARERARLLARWRDQESLVTYVCRNGTASLMDESAVLDDAMRA